MMLTNKAKEDFLIHLKKTRRCNEKSFSEFPAIFEDALIIEWLDSVGIIISVTYCKVSKGFDFLLYSEHYQISSGTHERAEATEKAILKANEIYNNLNTKENEK